MRVAAQKSVPQNVRLAPEVAARARLAIIRADYNAGITLSLERKCLETLLDGGVREKRIERFTVPGCFEIPILAQRLAKQRRYDALIALGAVIRGDTYHFDLVANECARGVMQVSLKYNLPIIFEVLAAYRQRDAVRRAGNNRLNKGVEAAEAALSMLATLSNLRK